MIFQLFIHNNIIGIIKIKLLHILSNIENNMKDEYITYKTPKRYTTMIEESY